MSEISQILFKLYKFDKKLGDDMWQTDKLKSAD